MQKARLSIAIPTYKRPQILHDNLSNMLPQLRNFGIPLYISDDSLDSETESMIAGFKELYPDIFYRKNNPPLGHDLNCLSTLRWPDTDFVWYLGDSMFIAEGGVERVLGAINEYPAFVFTNFNFGPSARATGDISDLQIFLVESAWYLTLTGATVYSRKVINWHSSVSGRKIYKNFMQLGIILEYASFFNDHAYWIGERCLGANSKKKSYWRKDVISVFANDWAAIIESFPGLFLDSMPSVLKSHSKRSGLYRVGNMLNFRADRAITANILRENKIALEKTSFRSLTTFRALLLLPPELLTVFKKLLMAIR